MTETPLTQRRAHEFHKYYDPFLAVFDRRPSWVDLHDASVSARHQPSASPDKTLTAFCQFVAVKLRARRAILSFFDEHRGYVLAESTRSLSLHRDHAVDPDDGLWLGHAVIPKASTVCEYTVDPPVDEVSPCTEPGPGHLHVVDDLQDDVRFSHYPSVAVGRFYAGAPIITPKGINIGALCVMDDEPRMGLTDEEAELMIDMAGIVMEHLEGLRARVEDRRGTQMFVGLSTFVQGGSDETTRLIGPLPTSTMPPSTRRSDSPSESITPERKSKRWKHSPEEGVSAMIGDAMTSGRKVSGDVHQREAKELMDRSVSTFPQVPGNPVSAKLDPVFQIAATTIRAALEVDGVLFLDASVSAFEDFVGRTNSVSTEGAFDPTGSAVSTDADSEYGTSPGSNAYVHAERVKCAVLGAAPAKYPDANHTSLSQRTLRALCRRYPRGMLWCLDRDGQLPSAPRDLHPANSETVEQDRPCMRRERELAELADSIPQAHFLVFVPMRDHATAQLRAGAVLYTSNPNRVFTDVGELNYMAVFCDVILAELARRDMQTCLRAETGFMSSISHELRTPLHGILGTVEQLYEESSPTVAAKMLAQIEVCGNMLMDVVEHLLDFSKVTRLSTDPEVSLADNRLDLEGEDTFTSDKSGLTDLALDEITEETVEAFLMSHLSRRCSHQRPHSDVIKLISIDKRPGVNWNCRIHKGAWKRILMNLLDNALKHTNEGCVNISLKQKPPHEDQTLPSAVLCIEDSGSGISKDYMVHVFRAFAKEDKFAPGAGLGMSIVAQLAQAMDGRVNVQSKPNVGTKITVTVPLDLSVSGSPLDQQAQGQIHSLYSHGLGKVGAALIGDWTPAITSRKMTGRGLLCSTVKKTLEELGVMLHHAEPWPGTGCFDLILEEDLKSLLVPTDQRSPAMPGDATARKSTNPILVICKTHLSAQRLETVHGHRSKDQRQMSYVHEPYGPAQFLEAILHCFSVPEVRQWPVIPEAKPDRSVRRPLLLRNTSSYENSHRCSITGVVNTPSRCDKKASDEKPSPHVNHAIGRTLPVAKIAQVIQNLPGDVLQNCQYTGVPPSALSFHDAPTLLLVDDNDINLQLLSTYCKKKGYKSSEARNGLQAVEMYQHAVVTQTSNDVALRYSINGGHIHRLYGTPQVILMDINMPVMDGFEATQAIRTFEKKMSLTQPVLIIALTGLSSAEARQQAFASGIDFFLSKPVKLRELSALLKTKPLFNGQTDIRHIGD